MATNKDNHDMTVLEAIATRFSVRRYTDEKISDDRLKQIVILMIKVNDREGSKVEIVSIILIFIDIKRSNRNTSG
ncbi:MAG: hypothetical protein E7559_06725, partial [Ruminococcaceae bacterium]|nr:hypothetical protein [Oscillospiraceae bacterium]